METVVKKQVVMPPQQVTEVHEVTESPIPSETPRQYKKKVTIFKTSQIIWYILGIIEILLGFRMTLKALGANPLSGFTSFIYAITDPLALPFSGIFGLTVSQNAIFEWSTIVAGIVYFLIALGIVELLKLFKPSHPAEVHEVVDNQPHASE